jgi:hypothetical protein
MKKQREAKLMRGSFAGRAAVLSGLLALAGSWAVALATGNPRSEVNRPGNILIADQFNNRVIETTPDGNIVWQFGIGPNDFSPKSILGCNDAQRVGPHTLMAGTGIPPGVDPAAPNGAADNRVILVNPGGNIIWQYGQFGVAGSDANQLNTPVQNTWLPDRHVLITDQANQRIIEVSWQKDIVWQYGTTGVPGDGFNQPSRTRITVGSWKLTRMTMLSGSISRTPTPAATPRRCRPARFDSRTATRSLAISSTLGSSSSTPI